MGRGSLFIARYAMGNWPKATGVYAPTVTAFNPDESLNEDATRDFVRFLLRSGVHGLAPMGSAGEFIALTDQERMQVAERGQRTDDYAALPAAASEAGCVESFSSNS